MSLSVLALLLGSAGVAQAGEMKAKAGVTVNGQDVTGLTAEGIKQVIAVHMQDLGARTFTIKGGEGKSLTPSLTELGLLEDEQTLAEEILRLGNVGNIIQRFKEETDIKTKGKAYTTAVSIDEKKLTDYLTAHATELGTEKKDGSMSIGEGGAFVRTPGIDGTKADVEKTKVLLINALKQANSKDFKAELSAEMIVDPARGKAEELAKVKDALGSFSSNYDIGSVTDVNVSRASNLSNGKLLYPGETMSFASCIMPFTYENGYTSGGAYIDGRIEQVIAGGICQTSSTAYMAAMYAELEIVERHQHSHLVQSVPLSMDSTITDGGGLDLKIKNNTAAPIFMVSTVGGGTLNYTFYGQETRPANRKVDYSAVKIDEWAPKGNKVSVDTSLALGSTREIGHSFNGYTYQLWKTVTVDGKQTENNMLYQNTYAPLEGGIAVGAAGANSEEVAKMEAARSGGVSAVQAVASEVEKRIAEDERKKAEADKKKAEEEKKKKETEEKKKAGEQQKEPETNPESKPEDTTSSATTP